MVFQVRSKVFWTFQVWMYMVEKVGVQPTCAFSYFCLEFAFKCDHVECYEGGFFMLLLPFVPLFNYGKCIKFQPRWKWDFQWTKLCYVLSFLHFAFLFVTNLKVFCVIVTWIFFMFIYWTRMMHGMINWSQYVGWVEGLE